MELCNLDNTPLGGAVLDAYHTFIQEDGSEEQVARIDRAISAIASIDRFYVSEREDLTHSPNLIAYRLEDVLQNRVGDYVSRYFRRDPVGRALEATTENGGIAVLRVGADDIMDAEYRRSFFEEPAIVERLSFVQRFSNRWLIMNVLRRSPAPRFSNEELNSLASLSQLLLPLVSRRAELDRKKFQAPVPNVDQLEQRFAENFPELSPRERQVCARTAIGMSSEATAIDLGLGIGTVHTYRKRAFARLNICSAFQLAHLVMH